MSEEEKAVNKRSLKKMESKIKDQLEARDEASNIRAELEEKIAKAKEEAEEVSELNETIMKAEEMLEKLDRYIGIIEDSVKKERSLLESLRVLTLARKISSIIGGFLLFFGGILLTLSILLITKILVIPHTISVQLFFGYILLIASITMLFSGVLHQVV